MTKITPRLSPLHVLNITYQSPQETLQGTPTTLPTSEPTAGNEQVSYTVASGDLPTFSGSTPVSKIWIAAVYAAGKTATAATISWRMKRNGTNVATGSTAVAANTYYTLSSFFSGTLMVGIAVGDVLTISLWSNQADSNWDYNAYQIQPSRAIVSNVTFKQTLCQVAFTLSLMTLSLGNPSVQATSNVYFRIGTTSSPYGAVSGSQTVNSYTMLTGCGVFIIGQGDQSNSNGGAINVSATYRPYYLQSRIPTSISWRYLYPMPF